MEAALANDDEKQKPQFDMRPSDHHTTKRWRKQEAKQSIRHKEEGLKERHTQAKESRTFQEMKERRQEQAADFKELSAISISCFEKGDLQGFARQLERLEALKLGNIRSLINQEGQSLEKNEERAFNHEFEQQMHGGSDDDEDE